MPDNLLDLTAYGLAREVEAGEVSASEAAEVANARTGEVEDEINALVTITPGLALERAEAPLELTRPVARRHDDGRLRPVGHRPSVLG